ncbi:conserved hypothetical protein [Ricinus communis]|uniref:Uncharacterized protein n=1 Tax=Ricinus communis TaxID=3988 RepID=B9SGX6_RICCO|nr:conserved hypothetical protein [Ricinus communis]
MKEEVGFSYGWRVGFVYGFDFRGRDGKGEKRSQKSGGEVWGAQREGKGAGEEKEK